MFRHRSGDVSEIETVQHGAYRTADRTNRDSSFLAAVSARHLPMGSIGDLGSAATSLDALITRVSRAADELLGSPQEDLGIALAEVERSLRTANRRLERVVRELRSRSSQA